MKSTLRASLLAAAAVGGLGCSTFGAPPAPPPGPPKQVYAVWEFDTLAQLDTFLDTKGCEGWALAEVLARGPKLVAVVAHDRPAPAPDPACRPTP